MEDRVPYGLVPAAPATGGPRNLAGTLAAWLRTQGFTASEQQQALVATVAAHWLTPGGERFELDYTWLQGQQATCQLQVRYPHTEPEVLVAPQHVRRLKEARLLLLGNVRYHNARLLARLAAPINS